MTSLYVIRRTENWATGGIDPWGLPMQTVWDEAFDAPFLAYRAFLNSLREENVRLIRFTKTIEEFDPDLGRQLLRPGRQVFPSDDDDWYHPDILGILADLLDTDATAHRWRYAVVEQDKALVFGDHDYKARSHWRYHTNNFCLRTPWPILNFDHTYIDQQFGGHPGEKYIDETLSVHNRHLGSQSLWWHNAVNSAEDLIALFETFRRPPSGNLPPVFDPYVDRLYEFYKKLRLRPRRRWL